MSEEIKLLPCPFCGNEDIAIHNDHETKPVEQTHISYWGYCNACSAEGRWAETPDEAMVFWNTRATPQPPVEQLKKDISNAAKIGLLTGALEGLLHYPLDKIDSDLKNKIQQVLKEYKTYGD